ncbi:hypothetical protein BMG00_04185 [Thioclava marina]|uniref:TonB C-terminal domain-containing protein n=1 Tax=Thioclava marina TaxID=1915077 RepID=A0ABX3MNC6_9RHOB|nr:TonB family protein [Thioclava marina]OOY13015.1 hypothetical protein BMG00_04185 [Thioclava marina]
MTARGLAFAGALLAALGVHAGVLAIWEPAPSGGAQSSGEGGEALVSLAPASAAMEAMVAQWERPPALETSEPKMAEPVPPEAQPESAEPQPQDQPRVAAPSALTAPPAPDAPLPAQADPAPPETPRPLAKPVQPETKPVRPKAPAPRQPEPSQPSRAQPKQLATGQGANGAAGDNQSAPAATLSAGQIRSLMGSWGGQIRARVERHKTPPAGAGAGRVVVALNVARDGRLLGAAVAKSSGNAALDQAALDAVRRAGRFPAAPQGLAKARYSFTLPITFR